MVQGEHIRDWSIHSPGYVLFPYDQDFKPVNGKQAQAVHQFLWPYKEDLWRRRELSGDHRELNRTWWEWNRFLAHRYRTRCSIPFAFVQTHNQFIFDTSGKMFQRSSPVIKLPHSEDKEGHLRLLGLLNSSTAAFWMRQTFHDKGGGGIGGGIAAETWERFLEYDATKLKQFPLPPKYPSTYARILDSHGKQLEKRLPDEVCRSWSSSLLDNVLKDSKIQWYRLLNQMISFQEELDWHCYRLYSLIVEDLTYGKEPPPIELGQRAFEIVMARKMAEGELETTWFERHGSTPFTEIPTEWPEDYRRLVERRIELIETDRNIDLIEQPEYKRRWNTEPWKLQAERALRNWLLNRLESYFDFDGRMNDKDKPTAKIDITLISTARLSDVARQDADFMQVGELYRNDPAFDVHRLVAELVESESVPLLPILRYQPSGLRKRKEWEQTWDLQRQEDAIDARTKLPKDDPQYLIELQAQNLKRREIGDISVPPKYMSSDFQNSTYWRLRGKLDVPKERWVSFPHCEGADGMLVIASAGYDHLQLARATSAYYVDIQERRGGRDDTRLVPLLACLIELLPWLKQWHNEVDPEFGMRMGDYFEGFIQEEARQMGKTLDQIRAWEPPKNATRRRKRPMR